jgi:hypothetical protein
MRKPAVRAGSRVVAGVCALLVLGIGRQTAAQGLPSDLRPFVKLGSDYLVQEYLDPTVRGTEVVDPGALQGTRQARQSIGSGTVVTDDGLIVTNFHVYNALSETTYQRDPKNARRLVKITPIGPDMLVYEIRPDDPLGPPVVRYRAGLVAANSNLDVAILKIHAQGDGKPLPPQRFAFVRLGNPYGIEPLGMLQVLGYPGGGGETLTPTTAQFSGYTMGAPDAKDGSLKAVATVAGGNSGGSALYGGRLIGIPTRVSLTDDRGARFAYFHPITWAVAPLAITALRFHQQIPEIDQKWVEHPRNTDVTRTRIFLGGRVISASTQRPVPGATVLFYRSDRTFDQISKLYDEVQQILTQHTPDSQWSQDATRSLKEGEFFYYAARTSAAADADGFFLVAVPRNQRQKVLVEANGFRTINLDGTSGDGLFADIGLIQMPSILALPSPTRR